MKADGTPQSTPFGDTAMKVVNARTGQFANTKSIQSSLDKRDAREHHFERPGNTVALSSTLRI